MESQQKKTLTELLQPMPGIVVALMEEAAAPVLVTEMVKIRERTRIGIKKRLMRGVVVAAGAAKRYRGDGKKDPIGQPPPSVGTRFIAEWGYACMTVHPGDSDLPELGDLVPEGSVLCFFGRVEPWDTHILAEESS